MDSVCLRCSKTLQPPFWKCIAGHPLCSSCSRDVQVCPSCHTEFPDTAAMALQGMQNLCCSYNYNKCTFTGNYEALKLHEATCPYKELQFKCFAKSDPVCDWSGVRVLYPEHLLTEHSFDPPTLFRTGFIYDIHTASTSLDDWKDKDWHGLFLQELSTGNKLYLCSCQCSSEVFSVTVFALAQESEPVQIVIRSQAEMGVEQSPMQVYIGHTILPGQADKDGLTIGVDQLHGFLLHEFRKVEDRKSLVALVSVQVVLGESALESLYRQ